MRASRWVLAGLFVALASTAAARVTMTVDATPTARRPESRVVIAVSLENDLSPRSTKLTVQQREVAAERVVELDVELAPGARKRLLVSLETQPGSQDFDVRLSEDEQLLAELQLRIPSVGAVQNVVGVLGPVPGWLQRRRGTDVTAVEVATDGLPSDARTWPDLDALLWPDPRVTDLDEPTVLALREWVLDGGTLLVGTAADQPRALEELGFSGWPATGEAFAPVGLGFAARSTLDLARSEPPAGLLAELERQRTLPEDLNYWSFQSEAFETYLTARLGGRFDTPPPPVWPVVGLLLVYLVFCGPAEWLLHRLAAKRARRARFVWLRRPVLLVAITSLVFVVVGGFAEDRAEVARVDVIDVDLETGAARARAYFAVRKRAGGWTRLEVPEGANLTGGRNSISGQRSWYDSGRYEPPRVLTGSRGPEALRRKARALAEQWSVITWRLAYEPDAEMVEQARRLSSARGAETTWAISRLAPARPAWDTLSKERLALELQRATQIASQCWTYGAGVSMVITPEALEIRPGDNWDPLLDCAVSSMEPSRGAVLRTRHWRRPDMEWPEGADALIALEPLSRGPELRVDGALVPGNGLTIWRIRLRGQREEAF